MPKEPKVAGVNDEYLDEADVQLRKMGLEPFTPAQRRQIKRDSRLPPKNVLDAIWRSFATDRKKNRATAYVNLQQAFAGHHDDIVPRFATEKEYMAMIADIEQWTKADQQSESGDPAELVSAWLRGDTDLSRVRMEGILAKGIQ